MKGWGGKKEATVLVHGVKVPAHNAAWLNSIMTRSFDFGIVTPYIGDTMVPSHVSESTVPTAVTAAEWQRASGKELITALVLGEDVTSVAPRLALTLRQTVRQRTSGNFV